MPLASNAGALGAFGAKNLQRLAAKADARRAARDAKTAQAKADRKAHKSTQRAAQEARAAAARGSSRFRQNRTDYDKEDPPQQAAAPAPWKGEVVTLGLGDGSPAAHAGGGVSFWTNGVAGSGASQIFPGRFSRASIPGFGFRR